MALQIGRQGRLYLVKEGGTYAQLQDGTGGSNTLSAAARAMRHVDVKFGFDPFNRVNSNEKKTSPGHVVIFDRRPSASLNTLSALIRPSGTLNTLAEADPVLEAVFGSKTNVTLSTTIAVGGAGTTTADTLTSAAGLAAGDAILIAHQNSKKYVRFITSIVGAAVTWAPALPTALSDGQAVKGCVTYKLTTNLAISLAMLHVLPNFRRELRGIGLDKFSVTLDANQEPTFTASGPASQQLNDANAVVDPVGFTSVGGNPPSGIVGETYIGNTLYLMKKSGVDLTNSLAVRNEEYGASSDTGYPTEVYRSGRREVTVSLDAFVETAATLHDLTIAGTNASFFNQTGRTEGNTVAVYAPKVYWQPPDTDTPEGPSNWSFKGTALESADGANDELYFALA